MNFQVTIQPSGHQYTSSESLTLLQSALDAGFVLPYGCRNGACGACKGKILSGSVAHGEHTPSALTADEIARGLALFCCAKPTSDVVIECREVGAIADIPVRKLPARVQKMERLAPDVMAVHLKLPTNERLQFLAGQYVDILLKDGRRRSFSVANAPHDDELLSLHIRLVPGGQFTEHVFSAMKERDILRIEGPLGSFYLREDRDTPIVLLAGGTGFAPIKAIVEHAIHIGLTRPITLYWGSRDRAGLYMEQRAAGWESQLPGFKFVPVLSDSKPEDGWQGRTGLVHHAVIADLPDLSSHEVYACGAPAMIDAARLDFTTKCGLPEAAFFADSFTFAADSPKSP